MSSMLTINVSHSRRHCNTMYTHNQSQGQTFRVPTTQSNSPIFKLSSSTHFITIFSNKEDRCTNALNVWALNNPVSESVTRPIICHYYRLLAGLPGVARAFSTLKYYVYALCKPHPRCTPKFFNPSTTCPGSSSTYLQSFSSVSWKLCEWQRQTETDRQSSL